MSKGKRGRYEIAGRVTYAAKLELIIIGNGNIYVHAAP
jgi:hypothetical protein